MAKKKKMMFMADTIMEKMTDFSLPVPQTERPIIKVFRNLWYSIVDYRVPQMFFSKTLQLAKVPEIFCLGALGTKVALMS